MAITAEAKQKVKELVKLGQTQGYLTQDDVLSVFPTVEDDLQLLEYIVMRLQGDDVEIIERSEAGIEEVAITGGSGGMTFEEKIAILKKIRSHVSTDPIRAYLHEIGRIPLLNAEEEVTFAKRIEEGENELYAAIKKAAKDTKKEVYVIAVKKINAKTDDSKDAQIEEAKREVINVDKKFLNRQIMVGLEAKDLLTTANLRLVVSIAKNYLKRGLDLLDLIQEGNLGLMRAVEKFEYRKGFKFSTYATWWIRQAITRAIADQARTIRVPVHMIETINKLSKVSSELTARYGRRPTPEEVAKEMQMDVEKVHEIIRISQKPQPLETPIGEEEKNQLVDIIPDEVSAAPSEVATWSFLRSQISDILEGLTDRERKVLELRFGIRDGVARTLEEVGHEFKVTRERIRQIEAKALKRLKSDEVVQALQDYLG